METNVTETPAHVEEDAKALNKLLRGEHAAVETYSQCIDKVDDAMLTDQLQRLKQSHEHRVGKLTSKIRLLGGEPETGSGAWGSFAKLIEGGAKLFGTKAAIAALEEGEDHGKKEYADLEDMSAPIQAFVRTELQPEQQRTHDALSAIKERC